MTTDEYTYPWPLGTLQRDEARLLMGTTSDLMADFLASVKEAICGPRQEHYGPPEENHARTAVMWSAYLGERLQVDLSPRDVCLMNILQKCSREGHCATMDGLLDIAGYAANASVCADT